jgi:hypothetical protein
MKTLVRTLDIAINVAAIGVLALAWRRFEQAPPTSPGGSPKRATTRAGCAG